MRNFRFSAVYLLEKQFLTYRINYTLLLVFALVLPMLSQAQQVSEEEVNIQGKFIEANREHLLGKLDEAAELYLEILKELPDNDAVAYELARIYNEKEEGQKALRYIRLAIESAPENHWYRRFLATLYQKQNKNREAADVYEELVSRDPDNEDYYNLWAYFLVQANEVKEALKVYDKYEKRIGITEDVIRRKHSLYVGLGDNKKAAEELLRLIEAYPNRVEYRHLLAGFYEQIGEEKSAQEVYQNILDIAPDDPRASMALAGNSAQQSDDTQFMRSLKPVFEKPDIDIDLKIAKLMPFIQKVADTGDQELAKVALQLTDILERVHPEEAKAFAAAGDLLYYSGEPIKALEKYKQSLEFDDTVFLVWEQVLRIHLEAKDFQSLRKDSEYAMDLYPNKAVLYYWNGLANARLKRPEDAIDAFSMAGMMVGNDGQLLADIKMHEGLVYFNMKKFAESETAFEKALELNPKDPEVLNSYSYTLALRSEKLDKASEMIQQALDLSPKNPSFLATYGWILYKKKDYKAAKKWLAQAMENGGADNPTILERYGDVLFHLNDSEGALQYWTEAREKGSTSELLEKKIADRQLYE